MLPLDRALDPRRPDALSANGLFGIEIPPTLVAISGWLYAAIVVACVLTAILRKRNAAGALGWSLAIVFLPVVGPFCFVTFGCTRISRKLRRKIAHRDQFLARFSVHATLEGHGHDPHPIPAEDRWGRLSSLLEALEQAPRRRNNEFELFTVGEIAFAAMDRAIRAAEQHVHVEFYIFRDDALGRRFAEALCDRARNGVRVRVILDGVGSFGSHAVKRQLLAAGVEVQSFLHPLRITSISPNLRNHRKLVLCDGRVAFFGGMNVGVEYLGSRRTRGRTWCDFHARVAGPAVWDLQWMFAEDWHFCTGSILEDATFYPELEASGEQTVQVLAGGPDCDPSPIHQAMFGAITRGTERIDIATPYLIPDPMLCEALAHAARTGIRVRIVTQHPPVDHQLAFYCSLSFIRNLDAAGVEVWGYQAGMMHAKAITVDGVWAMLGTANMDNRSLFLNFEQMVILDEGPGQAAVETALDGLFHESTRLDAKWLAARPLHERWLQAPARLLAPLL